ncbi:hypothetical protein BJ322DRAFT_1114817 [Thelephora terrestris]|uniref:CxC2-like cysteine cluster KDZ transposase-associated domain-containing protein n=1 Tax=Thelephora terrestris TaxID=56493 RepID=A0A9P6H1W1_9AGAM|nr:hypothetical protein BJ322DRAFT_1114817 [Thelephora terrestris]
MSKREATGSRPVRKKRRGNKGNSMFTFSSLDPVRNDKKVVENVRVWNVSTSEKTGRIRGTRKTLQHFPKVSPPEEPSPSEVAGETEEAIDVEEAGALADSETVRTRRPKRKRVKGNDSTKMEQWIQHRSVFLDELLRLDGLGDASEGLKPCPDCANHPGSLRCGDCFGGVLRCSGCMVSAHKSLPLHRIQLWNGDFFENTSLETLGLVVDLSHSGEKCPMVTESKCIFVIDVSGYHFVRVRFCVCPHTSFLETFRQLLRVRWFPASILQPKTVFTFDLLDTYHKISMQGKLNLYDFYNAIMQKTDNRGHSKIEYRYHEMSRCVRQWRHLKDIKRGAAGHSIVAVDDLGDGALAVECPACPHPGRNLPPGWENESKDKS